MVKIKLDVTEFGPIQEADININKINVIGGVNATGKTTLSKLLYCFLTGIAPESGYLINRSMKQLFNEYISRWGNNGMSYNDNSFKIKFNKRKEPLSLLLNKWDDKNSTYEYFKNFYTKLKETSENLDLLTNKECTSHLKRIENAVNENKSVYKQYWRVMQFLIMDEGVITQEHADNTKIISNINDNLEIKLRYTDVTSANLNVHGTSGDIPHINNIFYIDSPSLLDGNKSNSQYTEQYKYKYLYNNLIESEKNIYDDVYNEQIIKLEKDISKMIKGHFKYDSDIDQFIYYFNNKPINMFNTSSGYKQMGIIQMLLANRKLVEDSFLIMDEPEVNLHPEFQIKYAEILIKLVKKLNITLYINSHSPLFIEAIDLYSNKYDLVNATQFYIAEQIENSDKFNFKNIPRNELFKLYDNLGNPYRLLDDMMVNKFICDDCKED